MSAEALNINRNRTNQVIDLALSHREKNALTFPEEPFVQRLKNYEALHNVDGFAATALFFTTMFIRGGRTKDSFDWLINQDLEENAWLFMGNIVSQTPEQQVKSSCSLFFRPPGYAVDGVKKWKYNLELLNRRYGNNIINLFIDCNNSANESIKRIHLYHQAKTQKKIEAKTFLGYDFKLAQLAIQWIHKHGLWKFHDIEKSGFPQDFQVIRIALQTAILSLTERRNLKAVGVNTLVPQLSKICEERKIDPRYLQETIWHIGNKYCNKNLHKDCPLLSRCIGIVKSTGSQNDGKFGPEDIKDFRKSES
jgi:hypothetical protein